MAGHYRLTVVREFSASHQIENYCGKCEELHGHNFGVEVVVRGENPDPSTGMLLDFKILKQTTNDVLDTLDHKHLNKLEIFKGISPSSEHIARYVFGEIKARLAAYDVVLQEVTVSEKAGQSATYYED